MIKQLSACRWLYLDVLTDGPDNALRLVLNEARVQDEVQDIEVAGVIIPDTRAIEHDDSCRVFEVIWETYICYIVRNESYTTGDGVDWQGQRVRFHEQSPFLAYVASQTVATPNYPGPFTHIEIVCDHHVVDVASTVEPTVRLLRPGRPRGV